MNTRNRFLTGVLLVLIGVLIGGVFVMLQQGQFISDRSDVQFTEIKRSEKPLFSDEDLEKLDARFLFKNVADRVIPTVVYISTVVSLDDEAERYEEDSFWDRFSTRRARTVGSGVIVSEDGYIVTNNHVIQGAVDDGISVVLNNKRLYEARVIGTDPTTDLAIIKIDAQNLPAITLGNSDEVSVGEWVLAIGNPFQLRSTVTAGIVSALSRSVQIADGNDSQLRIESFIQTDAAINKGNSGGALVNTSGELVGINTAIASQSGTYQGYGFAVPSNLVSKVMRDLIEYGEVHRALLGVNIRSINYQRARDLGMEEIIGVEIVGLSQDGAAAQSDLKQNDVILTVNEEPVNEPNELQEQIAVRSPGDVVQLKIWRSGSVIERNVELGRAESINTGLGSAENAEPENEYERGLAFGSFSIGFKVMALSKPGDRESFDLIISEIYSSSEAARQGLKEGYIIREVNGEPIEALEALENQLTRVESGDTIMMKIETPDGTIGYYNLKK